MTAEDLLRNAGTRPPLRNLWREAVLMRFNDLELVASWASITGFQRVCDLCRLAEAELIAELESERCRDPAGKLQA